jgi:hypothetical protein
MAVVALVMGILGLLTAVTSIFAVIFGHIGLSQTKDGRFDGRNLAIVGLILGYVVMIPWLIVITVVVLVVTGTVG